MLSVVLLVLDHDLSKKMCLLRLELTLRSHPAVSESDSNYPLVNETDLRAGIRGITPMSMCKKTFNSVDIFPSIESCKTS